jgi:hypothetical protein
VQKVQIGRKKQVRSRESNVVLASRCVRGIKVGGKRKHTQPSTTRKEKYPMERKEKQLTEEERNT